MEQNLHSIKDYDKELIIDGLNHLMLQGCSGCMEVRDNRHGDRKLYSDGIHYSFVAPVPKGQNPYHVEVRVMPLNHQSHFEDMIPEEVVSFARVLHETMVLLGRKYPNMGYNFELRQGPWKTDFRTKDIRSLHWEFSIYPAWSKLDTEKHTGFIPHLLGAPVLKITPEQIGKSIKQYKN